MGFRYGIDDVRELLYARASVIEPYQTLPPNWSWLAIDRVASAPYNLLAWRDGRWESCRDIDTGTAFLFPHQVEDLINHLEGLLFCGVDVLDDCRLLMSYYRIPKGRK